MHQPLPRKKSPRRPRAGRLLAIDAWIDSTLYEAGFRLSEAWENLTIFFRRFRLTGWRRALAELAVTFLDRYGNEIGQRGIIQRESVPVDEMPDHVIQAVLATEDRRFFDHFGIDFLGLFRAMQENVRANSVVQGGSLYASLRTSRGFSTPNTIRSGMLAAV